MMNIEGIKASVRSLVTGSLDSAARAEQICDAMESPQRELEEARKDGERIGFFEQHPRVAVRSSGYLGSPDLWAWRDYHGVTHDAASLRDALNRAMDAARQKSPNTPPKTQGET